MFEQAFKNIDDVLWKEAGCSSELDYTEQSSWLLFLKYLDGLEQDKAAEAAMNGKKYTHLLQKPYRWESWAAPKSVAALAALVVAVGLGLVLVQPTPLCAADSPEQTIDQVYGAQLARVRATPETTDDLALARDMTKDAKTMPSDPALETALLRRALDLAVADPEGAPTAQAIIGVLVQCKGLNEKDAWQELVKKGQDALRRRSLGGEDKMLESYFQWQLQLVRVALEAHDATAAGRQLGEVQHEAQGLKLKYEADTASQLAARIRMETPFVTAAAEACRRVDGSAPKSPPNADPKLNLATGETVLADTGDWNQALPYLVRSKDERWVLILNLRQRSGSPNGSPADGILPSLPAPLIATESPPPVVIPPLTLPANAGGAPGGSGTPVAAQGNPAVAPASGDAPMLPLASLRAADLIAAAQYLTALAAPAKRPSPVGKVALLWEAVAIYGMAQSADSTGLNVTQKLELVKQQRTTREAADQAVNDLRSGFDRIAQTQTVNLCSGNMKADWVSANNFDQWKQLEDGGMECTADTSLSLLYTRSTEYQDFIFEGEFKRADKNEHNLFLLRNHNGAAYYKVEFTVSSAYLSSYLGQAETEVTIAKVRVDPPVQTWIPFRMVLEGEHCMVWINDQRIFDAHVNQVNGAGDLGILCLPGTAQYRHMRVRELK